MTKTITFFFTLVLLTIQKLIVFDRNSSMNNHQKNHFDFSLFLKKKKKKPQKTKKKKNPPPPPKKTKKTKKRKKRKEKTPTTKNCADARNETSRVKKKQFPSQPKWNETEKNPALWTRPNVSKPALPLASACQHQCW